MIFGFWFSQLTPLATGQFSAQLRPNLWHLDTLCVRDPLNFSTKGGCFALSGKDVEVHIFSTGIFEHTLIQSRVTYNYGGVDTIGRGTELACVVGGHVVGIARQCHFFSYAFTTNEDFIEAVESFLTYKNTHEFKPCVVLIDMDRTPSFENKNIINLGDEVELSIKKITDLGYIVIVPAGDGYKKNGILTGSVNALINSPARMDSVFAIAAHDYDYSPAPFSNYGVKIAAFAPGCGVVTGTVGNQKVAVSSTSIAAACVTGIAVEFLQQNNYANRKNFDLFIKRHFFNTGLTEYLDYYLTYDPSYVPDDRGNYATFWYNNTYYNYKFSLVESYNFAHCPYLKSKIVVLTDYLGEVFANKPFTLQLPVESKTIYGENKPLFFKLIGQIPDWTSFEVGEQSGKIFGICNNVFNTTPCVFTLNIDDGLYSITQTFVFNVLVNQKELFGLGSQLKTEDIKDLVLNLSELKRYDTVLNNSFEQKHNLKIITTLQRKLYLLDKITGNFLSKTHTDKFGEFKFYAPSGTYQIFVIDEKSVYNVRVLDNMRTQ